MVKLSVKDIKYQQKMFAMLPRKVFSLRMIWHFTKNKWRIKEIETVVVFYHNMSKYPKLKSNRKRFHSFCLTSITPPKWLCAPVVLDHTEEAREAISEATQDGAVSGGGGASPGWTSSSSNGSLLEAPQAAISGGRRAVQSGGWACRIKIGYFSLSDKKSLHFIYLEHIWGDRNMQLHTFANFIVIQGSATFAIKRAILRYLTWIYAISKPQKSTLPSQ